MTKPPINSQLSISDWKHYDSIPVVGERASASSPTEGNRYSEGREARTRAKKHGTFGDLKQFADRVLEDCEPLGAYLYTSGKGGSMYIKFRDKRLGSLRIGDHDGIPHLKYRWNLRTDHDVFSIKPHDGIDRYYYPTTGLGIEALINDIFKWDHLLGVYERECHSNKELARCVLDEILFTLGGK